MNNVPCYCLKHGTTTVARDLNEQPDCPMCILVERLITAIATEAALRTELACARGDVDKHAHEYVLTLVAHIKELEADNKQLSSQLAGERAAHEELHKEFEAQVEETTQYRCATRLNEQIITNLAKERDYLFSKLEIWSTHPSNVTRSDSRVDTDTAVSDWPRDMAEQSAFESTLGRLESLERLLIRLVGAIQPPMEVHNA